jgi:V/A-type H+-transporting ATPase subunit C
VGRISVRRRDRLDAAKLDRLLAVETPQEAVRALQEIGWAAAEQSADYEQAAGEHMRRACAFVREVSPQSRVTDCFLLRHDVQNLKLLLKARCLGQDADFLSTCGTLPVDVLRHAVAEAGYTRLPEGLREPLADLERRLAVREDPLDIDVTLDKALYALAFDALRGAGSRVALAYFAARVDLVNALMLLRVRAMGRGAAFLAAMLISGGNIPEAALLERFDRPEELPRLLSPYGPRVAAVAKAAVQGALPGLEKAMDDYLLSLFAPYRARADAIEALVGYLLVQEREASAVRLILAGKLNGFTGEAIRERLRDLYG